MWNKISFICRVMLQKINFSFSILSVIIWKFTSCLEIWRKIYFFLSQRLFPISRQWNWVTGKLIYCPGISLDSIQTKISHTTQSCILPHPENFFITVLRELNVLMCRSCWISEIEKANGSILASSPSEINLSALSWITVEKIYSPWLIKPI